MSETREIHLRDGTIRYQEIGTGEPLLFIHGLVVNGHLWRNVAPELAKDFRCIIPDWPLGAHELPMRPDADLRPPALAKQIVEFMDQLGLEEATLVANDTGGALAQLVAADHPDRVSRLVLVSCDVYEYFLPPILRPIQLQARIPGFLRALSQLLRIPMLQRLPIAFGWLMKKRWSQELINTYLGPARGSAGIRRDLKKVLIGPKPRYTLEAAEKLKSFDRPALFVWATEDKFFPVERARQLAGSMPNARFEEIADSYTFVPEDQPGRLIELVRDFVREPKAALPA